MGILLAAFWAGGLSLDGVGLVWAPSLCCSVVSVPFRGVPDFAFWQRLFQFIITNVSERGTSKIYERQPL